MKPSQQLIFALEKCGGGVHKRVDENRELLELLQAKAPELLQSCPWVVGWLQSNDEFLTAVAGTPEAKGAQPRFNTRPGFPRPWPSVESADRSA